MLEDFVPERGCGSSREPGGMYLVTYSSSTGLPLDDFLLDPPVLLPEGFPLSAQGVQLVERNGVWHIYDWIGECYYPNVLDFWEEIKAFLMAGRAGLSRHIPSTLDFTKLTPQSRYFPIHKRAWIDNYSEYEWWNCPRHRVDHAPPNPDVCCAGLWRVDLEGGETDDTVVAMLETLNYTIPKTVIPRHVSRTLPCQHSYVGYHRPTGVTPQYQPAIFASLPLHGIEVVKHPEGLHTERIEKANHGGLPVREVEE